MLVATLWANAIDAAMGIAFMYQSSLPVGPNESSVSFGTPYYTISLSLNVLLTLLIVVRLVLHNRNFGNVMGSQAGSGRVYRTIIIILIESCAPYAIAYLLFIIPWAAGSPVSNAFFPMLAQAQVRAVTTILAQSQN